MYLLIESAMMSVPPVLPPWVMMMAMPIPLMAPPMRALMRLSVMPAEILVRPGIMGMNWKNTKLMATQYMVFMPNPLPSMMNPATSSSMSIANLA